jgi:O-antigen/teichoic acid export membrane protein
MVYTVLNFLPAGAGLVITPLFTNHLKSTEEYGFIILANFFFAFFGVLVGLGFDSAYGIKFFHYNKDKEKQHQLLTTVLFLIALVFTALLLLFLLIGPFVFNQFISSRSFTFKEFGIYTLVMGLATVFNAVMLAYYRNINHLKQYSFQALLMAILPTAAQVVCIFFVSNTAVGVVQTRSLTSLAVVLPFVIFYTKKYDFRFNRSFVRPLLQLSLPFFLYSIIIFLFENVDRLLVEKNFNGIHALSIYGLAVTFASIGEMVRASMASALSPMVFQVMADDNDEEKINTFYRLFIWAILLLLSLMLLAIQPLFILFIKNRDFFESLQYIPFLFLALLPKIYYSIYQLPLSYYGRVKLLPLINLLSLLTGLGCFFMALPSIQIYAVIVSLFVSRSLQAVLTFFYLKRFGAIYRRREVDFVKERALVIFSFGIIGFGAFLYNRGLIPFWLIGFLSAVTVTIAGGIHNRAYVRRLLQGLRLAKS